MTPTQFTCENCGHRVPWLDAGLRHYEHRNQCPRCLWSKHILFGTATLRPCDHLMQPNWIAPPDNQPRLHTTECTCGFRWASYDEDWWATLTPTHQATIINLACQETRKHNGAPTIIYPVRPRYHTHPPPIPPAQLHTRPRAKHRPTQ